jgi:hypothetical protein
MSGMATQKAVMVPPIQAANRDGLSDQVKHVNYSPASLARQRRQSYQDSARTHSLWSNDFCVSDISGFGLVAQDTREYRREWWTGTRRRVDPRVK